MTRFLRLSLIAFALGAALHGQDAPPPDVEAALRERANQFFQYQLDGQYRKAEGLVAEDSKDFYYNSDRARYARFKVDSLQLLDNNTRAKVKVMIGVTINSPFFMDKVIDMPITSDWKLDDGKWCWFHIPPTSMMTPFGEMKIQQSVKPGQAAPAGPGNLTAVIESATGNALNVAMGKTKLETPSLELKEGASGELQVSNGAPGPVSVTVKMAPDGISVTPNTITVPAMGKASLTVTAAAAAKSGGIRLEVAPSQEELIAQIAVR